MIGLVGETLLPGEERRFGAPALDQKSVRALRVDTEVLALGVVELAEIPSLADGRWATRAVVVQIDGNEVVLRGTVRVRLGASRGGDTGAVAEVVPDAKRADDAPRALVTAAHQLLASIDSDESPAPTGDLADSLRRLVRSAAGPRLVARATAGHAELAAAVRSVAGELVAERGAASVERLLLRAGEPELSETARRSIWSQVAELLRRLDVADPAAPQDGTELAELQRRLSQAALPRAARDLARRELRLLRTMPTNHHDYSTYVAHLDLVARLPWHPSAQPDPPLSDVETALARDHGGLDQVKRRVMEYLAVRRVGGSAAGTVLCLVGPPGTGKTSVAQSIARALGRPFVRVPLGGVHDEAELRGHRMSYAGARAGRVLNGLARGGSASAVVLLDEIDKIGTDRYRSPAGALLEILDPEQNLAFQDNYLAIPFDLSHVLFIATANTMTDVEPALVDRLEVVELEGYGLAEKVALARSHLLPRLAAEYARAAPLSPSDDVLSWIIESHTREAGVRQLRRCLAGLHRARALDEARASAAAAHPSSPVVTLDEARAVLGRPRYIRSRLEDELPPGVATALAVALDGGATMPIEAVLHDGARGLVLTGRLGDVMRESAQTALSCLRAHAAHFAVDPAKLAGEVHVHAPDGATPKDGPSAGIALFLALRSAAQGRSLPHGLACTGEVTLAGRVLPVGGVRAKLLAAERAGLQRALVPRENEGDVPEGLRIAVTFVGTLDEAVAAIETDQPGNR